MIFIMLQIYIAVLYFLMYIGSLMCCLRYCPNANPLGRCSKHACKNASLWLVIDQAF